ncbi:RNA polymerase sigma factor [Nonomuraea sediminis]|uniref:RNA polymerase sigma factor n=1 Tax=Nonomuraea sediminis TaxID=2835864 RepID=UPI001BDDAC5B|nr:sigma-70 family RNA polymerase sigma factor [Nonomuraea sediminis]
MNDRVLVEALRARDPGALAALYDAHAERIYRYCWSLLMNTDSAQVALRDTLIAAEAHAASLSDPGKLRPWLYALARGECLRRRMASPPDAGDALAEMPEPDDPGDADLRVMAWNATQSLTSADREVLELGARHDLSTSQIAAVLGVPPRQVEAAQEDARERLRDAITAEILARKGPYDCARRARILAGFSGELTPDMRDHLVRHVQRCETCSPHRSRQVSAAKVFELLPRADLPDVLRVRVMSCFIDPELVPYRRYVARRTGTLDSAGFPVTGERRPRKWPQALAGALAAVAAVVAIAMIFNQFGGEKGGLTGIASGAFPATGEPPGIRLPWQPEPQDAPIMVEPILDSTATYPIGARHSVGPMTLTTPDTGPTRGPAPEPTHSTGRTIRGTTPPPTSQPPPPSSLDPREPGTNPQGGPPGHHHDRGWRSASPCPPSSRPTRTAAPTPTPTTPTSTPTTQAPTPTPTTPPPTSGPATEPASGQAQPSDVPQATGS